MASLNHHLLTSSSPNLFEITKRNDVKTVIVNRRRAADDDKVRHRYARLRTMMVFGILHNLCLQTGEVDEAMRIFEAMSEEERDEVSWNTVITGLARNGRSETAMEKTIAMARSGKKLDQIAIAAALSACGNLAALRAGEQVHVLGLKNNALVLKSPVIFMYGRCGEPEMAARAYEEAAANDVAACNSLISALAMNGKGRAAVEVFRKMEMADEVSTVGVLSACSHAGMVEEGLEIFAGIEEPEEEHIACAVDLLSRAGRTEEASALAAAMGAGNRKSVAGALIAGRVRARQDHKIDGTLILPESLLEPGNWVKVCNMAAMEGRWEEVEKMRGEMKEKMVRKEVGSSWIEVNGQIHMFVAGWPGVGPLLSALDVLTGHMREWTLTPTN